MPPRIHRNELDLRHSITVLLTSWNHRDFVQDCLESLLPGLSAGVSIVHVDTGSSDGTQEIVREFFQTWQSINVQFFRAESTVEAVQIAMGCTDSEYLLLLSTDDALSESYWLEVSKRLSRIPSNAATVFNFELTTCDSKLVPIGKLRAKWTRHRYLNRKRLLLSNPGTAPGALVPVCELRKSRFSRHGQSQKIEDLLLWVDLFEKVTFCVVNTGVVLYRRHPGTQSSRTFDLSYARALGYAVGYASSLERSILDQFASKLCEMRIRRKFGPLQIEGFAAGLQAGNSAAERL